MERVMERAGAGVLGVRYNLSLGAFYAGFVLFLLTLVDIRRGFLFPLSSYLKIGNPSAILYIQPRHFLLLLVAGLVAWLAFRYMVRTEAELKDRGLGLRTQSKLLALGIILFLVADLFIYRGVPAARIAAAGKMGVGQTLSLASFPGWLRPFGEGINYLALVWHATFIAMLIGGLFLSGLMAFVKPVVSRAGFKSHVAGALLALPQPFCSCCAAPIASTFYRGGVSLGPTLSFVVSSPMLNVTGLILAGMLLPTPYALARIAGGVILGIFVTYAVAQAALRWQKEPPSTQVRDRGLAFLSARALNRYASLFQLERFVKSEGADSPASFISSWLASSWRLARVVIPILFVGSVLTAALVAALPSPRNDFLGVAVAAALGTMLMIPTWTEIPVAWGLISQGLTGPAVALLLTLPAVSIPCLVVLAGALGNWKAPVLLGLAVFLLGSLAGLVFI